MTELLRHGAEAAKSIKGSVGEGRIVAERTNCKIVDLATTGDRSNGKMRATPMRSINPSPETII